MVTGDKKWIIYLSIKHEPQRVLRKAWWEQWKKVFTSIQSAVCLVGYARYHPLSIDTTEPDNNGGAVETDTSCINEQTTCTGQS